MMVLAIKLEMLLLRLARRFLRIQQSRFLETQTQCPLQIQQYGNAFVVDAGLQLVVLRLRHGFAGFRNVAPFRYAAISGRTDRLPFALCGEVNDAVDR